MVEIILRCTIFEFGFFVSKNYKIFDMKNRKCSKMRFFKKMIKYQAQSHLWISFRQLLTPKQVMVYYLANSCKIVWFGISWMLCPKYRIWGIFPTHFLFKKYNFYIRISKYWEIQIFEIHHAIVKHVRRQWISKLYFSQYF